MLVVVRAVLLSLLVCACNQVFGIQPTHLALPDAPPPVCPALGTAPTFTGELVAVWTGGCTMYSPSELHDLALAECGYVL